MNSDSWWQNLMKQYVKWADPRLEKYRVHRRTNITPEKVEPKAVSEPAIEAPASRTEFLFAIQNAPFSVFSKYERRMMETALSLDEISVSEIMIPRQKFVFVTEDETLGPLVLNRLFQTGLVHFPVQDKKGEVVGVIHTASLNSLETREAKTAKKLLDENLCYVRDDYSLRQLIDAFLRNDVQMCLVVDKFAKIIGMVTLADLLKLLFGETPDDGFIRDREATAVAKRQFAIDFDAQKSPKTAE